MIRFQRLLQIPVFLLFIWLLWRAAFPLPSWSGVDVFLRLDPLLSLGTMAADRTFIPRLAWAFAIIGLAFVLGRVFCGYLCPMGATIDFADRLCRAKRGKKRPNSFEAAGRFRNLKYYLLAGVFGTAVLGITSLFFFSPLSLATRFYSFVIYPVAMMAGNFLLDIFRPLFPAMVLNSLSFAQLDVHVFDTSLFTAALAASILLLGFVAPRFWCRNLCPAAAILAMCAARPFFRRHVSEACTACGRCLRSCPMAAIGEDYVSTAHSECIVCLKCSEICPESAISFVPARRVPSPAGEFDVGRRKVLTAGVAGMAAAAVTMTGLTHLHGEEEPRPLRSRTLIRPPGALPETAFQARCVRCGECMKGCLTNTLQPVWLEAGVSGLWTPRMTARLAGCEQNCNACGHLCPTGAIRPLDVEEKKYAKIGTARIEKTRCIAWEQNKRCLICDEVCPYNAITSRFTPGISVTVPFVNEDKCNGCGYCEAKCPVIGERAIVVEPYGELRLASGSYQQKARELGLVLHAKEGKGDQFILEGAPGQEQVQAPYPGVEQHRSSPDGKLPPGFLPEKQ